MTNQHESFPDLMHDDSFEVVMRGYSRRQVHDYMIRTRNQIRDLEERLARAIDQAEQGRIELAEARRRIVEAPQNYDDLSPRLAQILRLGEEEAAQKREDADAEATRVREDAATESEQLMLSAREQADAIMNAAQAEAERRVGEATAAAERMLAQAGGDAEETLSSAQQEADATLHGARSEAERTVTAARQESEQTVAGARAEAEATLGSARAEAEATLSAARAESEATLAAARDHAESLEENTGRRVSYLTDTHGEVMRRLNEIGSVLGDLLHQESAAGSLVSEPAVVIEEQRDAADEHLDIVDEPRDAVDEPRDAVEESPDETQEVRKVEDDDDIHVIVNDRDEHDDTDVRDPFSPVRH